MVFDTSKSSDYYAQMMTFAKNNNYNEMYKSASADYNAAVLYEQSKTTPIQQPLQAAQQRAEEVAATQPVQQFPTNPNLYEQLIATAPKSTPVVAPVSTQEYIKQEFGGNVIGTGADVGTAYAKEVAKSDVFKTGIPFIDDVTYYTKYGAAQLIEAGKEEVGNIANVFAYAATGSKPTAQAAGEAARIGTGVIELVSPSTALFSSTANIAASKSNEALLTNIATAATLGGASRVINEGIGGASILATRTAKTIGGTIGGTAEKVIPYIKTGAESIVPGFYTAQTILSGGEAVGLAYSGDTASAKEIDRALGLSLATGNIFAPIGYQATSAGIGAVKFAKDFVTLDAQYAASIKPVPRESFAPLKEVAETETPNQFNFNLLNELRTADLKGKAPEDIIIKTFNKQEAFIQNLAIKEGGVLGGGKAAEAYMGLNTKGKDSDYRFLDKKAAAEIVKSQFPELTLTETKNAIKIQNKGVDVADFATQQIGEPYVTTKSGLKIESLKSVVERYTFGVTTPELSAKRSSKDTGKLLALQEAGAFKLSEPIGTKLDVGIHAGDVIQYTTLTGKFAPKIVKASPIEIKTGEAALPATYFGQDQSITMFKKGGTEVLRVYGAKKNVSELPFEFRTPAKTEAGRLTQQQEYFKYLSKEGADVLSPSAHTISSTTFKGQKSPFVEKEFLIGGEISGFKKTGFAFDPYLKLGKGKKTTILEKDISKDAIIDLKTLKETSIGALPRASNLGERLNRNAKILLEEATRSKEFRSSLEKTSLLEKTKIKGEEYLKDFFKEDKAKNEFLTEYRKGRYDPSRISSTYRGAIPLKPTYRVTPIEYKETTSNEYIPERVTRKEIISTRAQKNDYIAYPKETTKQINEYITYPKKSISRQTEYIPARETQIRLEEIDYRPIEEPARRRPEEYITYPTEKVTRRPDRLVARGRPGIFEQTFSTEKMPSKKSDNTIANHAKSYNVYIRSGIDPQTGKARKIREVLVQKNLPYGTALNKGLAIADKYAQRTVILKPSKFAATTPDELVNKDLLTQFRPLSLKSKIARSKQDRVFVEKSKYAIDSYEEKQGIPYKAAKLAKQRKNQFGKFGGMRV